MFLMFFSFQGLIKSTPQTFQRFFWHSGDSLITYLKIYTLIHFSQSSSITEASLSDCLVSYPGHTLGES